MTSATVGLTAVGIGISQTLLDALFQVPDLDEAKLDYEAGHVRDAVGKISRHAHKLIEAGRETGDDDMVARGETLRDAAYAARLKVHVNVA